MTKTEQTEKLIAEVSSLQQQILRKFVMATLEQFFDEISQARKDGEEKMLKQCIKTITEMQETYQYDEDRLPPEFAISGATALEKAVWRLESLGK
jgi:DNA topoisomerase IA